MSDNETSLGYTFNFPIRTPADVSQLKQRTFGVDREATLRSAAVLQDVFGDLLPTRVGNYDPFSPDPGDDGFCGNFFFGLTWQLYRFIGNDGLLYWVYDAPEAIHSLMSYMERDRAELFRFLEREGLLAANTDTQMAGPRAYGYCSQLPGTRPRRAGEAQGPLGLGRVAGDDQHLSDHVQGVRAPASRGVELPVRPRLLWVLRAGARPAGPHDGRPSPTFARCRCRAGRTSPASPRCWAGATCIRASRPPPW